MNKPQDDSDYQPTTASSDRMLMIVYRELKDLAAIRLEKEPPGQTLQPTALVHEAYLRLVDASQKSEWDTPGHFFAAAAEAMRRILVERARAKKRQKRGGGRRKLPLEQNQSVSFDRHEEVLEIHDALSKLQVYDAQAAQLVKLRYFAGLGHQESAAAMGISRRKADRLWVIARAWLYDAINHS